MFWQKAFTCDQPADSTNSAGKQSVASICIIKIGAQMVLHHMGVRARSHEHTTWIFLMSLGHSLDEYILS